MDTFDAISAGREVSLDRAVLSASGLYTYVLTILAVVLLVGCSPTAAGSASGASASTATPLAVPATTRTPTGLKDCPILDPPGRCAKLDVGGSRLWIVCRGTGSPSVVFDAGFHDAGDTWDPLLFDLQPLSQVCVYDRAGLGSSDPPQHRPRTSRQIVAELHTLLRQAGVASPSVLVGHSFGGLNMQLYAYTYPTEVDGLVLVDSMHADQWARFPTPDDPRERATEQAIARGSNPEGIDFAASTAQVRAERTRRGPLTIPLIVVSAGQYEFPTDTPAQARSQVRHVLQALQADLVHVSEQGKQVIAAQSYHDVQRDQPELVVAAVREVVEAARRH
jgi:pimeloyl-ACP methyl ester carboxylesterase